MILSCEHLRERFDGLIRDHEGYWRMFRCLDCHTVRKEAA